MPRLELNLRIVRSGRITGDFEIAHDHNDPNIMAINRLEYTFTPAVWGGNPTFQSKDFDFRNPVVDQELLLEVASSFCRPFLDEWRAQINGFSDCYWLNLNIDGVDNPPEIYGRFDDSKRTRDLKRFNIEIPLTEAMIAAYNGADVIRDPRQLPRPYESQVREALPKLLAFLGRHADLKPEA